MKKEIKFSLVYRDMWQSSGKYQPRADQLVRIAPLIIEMGCFSRVETNGGAFEQVNLCCMERTRTKPSGLSQNLSTKRAYKLTCSTVVWMVSECIPYRQMYAGWCIKWSMRKVWTSPVSFVGWMKSGILFLPSVMPSKQGWFRRQRCALRSHPCIP